MSKLDFDPQVCNQCGQCCHATVMVAGTTRALRHVTCGYLIQVGEKTSCSVYHKRFKKAPWCLSLGEAYDQGRLPKACPYVQDDDQYQARASVEYMSEEDERAFMLATGARQLSRINPKVKIQTWNGPQGE